MRPYQVACIVVATFLLLGTAPAEARRRKHKGEPYGSNRSKTKTKWSTSTDMNGGNSQVSTEEHGYYVKRTFSPLMGGDGKRKSPPYLAIPIAWFSCSEGKSGCQQISNSGVINSPSHALSEGYLCDDDCEDAYEPICGKTPNEVAVFYNKCKLNVAKCRTHGLWTELAYDQCQQTYPKETTYTDKKFRCSPYFRDASTAAAPSIAVSDKDKDNSDESSEEQKDSDKKQKQKNKENIDITVPSTQKTPFENIIPTVIETVAIPPIPIKTAESQPVAQAPEVSASTSKTDTAKVTEAKKPAKEDYNKLEYVLE